MSREYQRWQVANTRRALKNRRVVAVSGARQTGKTTLTRQVAGDEDIFRSLDQDALLRAAGNDPHEFVKNSSAGTMVIDEIQKAPALLPEIKLAVDRNPRPGQYLLTGSVNIQTVATVSDSLAGRIKHIRLRPLTVGEILGIRPAFLQRAFAGDFPARCKGYDKARIFDSAFRGGYPEALRITDARERREWHRDYIDSLLKKDLHEIEPVRRLDAMRDLVKILAAWSGKYMDKAKIGGSLEISKPTFEVYVNAVESLFVVERVAPWTKTDYDLVGKKSKIFMADTGLMTSLLNWKRDELALDADRGGKLMETLVFQELAAQIDLESDYSLYQYRDAKQREIDFLVEKEGEGLVGIEVKASRSVSAGDFAPQVWFRDNLVKRGRTYRGLVLYAGEDTLSFGPNLLAVPVAALWTD